VEMKEGLFILVLLVVSSYAIDNRRPINHLKVKVAKTLNPASKPTKAATPLQPEPQFRQEESVEAGSSSTASGDVSSSTATVLPVGTAPDSSSTAHVKGTPGATCDSYKTCVECTDDDAKAFYCMWSAAKNVCQEDTDMDKIKRAHPEEEWTKQCAPKDPVPITSCDGCPILAIDHKPDRDIVDSTIQGSNGDYSLANEGQLNIIGSDPHDPVLGPITFPNGTNPPYFTLPSIQNDDGTINDPIQDTTKLTYSPCVGDGSCSASTSRFMSSGKKGKFAPVEVGSGEDHAERQLGTDSDGSSRMKLKPHVDNVEMQHADLDEDSNDDEDHDTETADIETGSRIVKQGTMGPNDGFTPTFSDDDDSSSSSSQTTQTTQTTPAPSSNTDSTTDQPRFTQSRRSETQGMSSGKPATGSTESTMEVTEYDDSVVGGKKIDEDEEDSKPTVSDDKQ